MEGAVLPCTFGQAVLELERRMVDVEPELVVCLGLAARVVFTLTSCLRVGAASRPSIRRTESTK